ncbi:MAG: Flp pilus assembly complex ATPase component TadA [Sedimentisphaerales bacterium]|nr:Flp pilus assembly complex ATPase component TadA [Sedimentisphaerales bacterium]
MPVFDVYDNKTPRRVVTDEPRVTIGRTDDNIVVVDDRLASRRHCEIRLSEIGYVVSDLKSRNGTQLNQDFIDRPIPLQDGDEIGIGSASIRFWSSKDKIPASSGKLPLIVKTSGRKSRSPASRADRAAKQAVSAPAVGPASAAKHGPASANRLEMEFQDIAAVKTPEGPLTLRDIIPLNRDGKPAHTVGEDQQDISPAMHRFKEILLKSLQLTATDIHIEPKEEQLDLRYRIDGYLHRAGSLAHDTGRGIYTIVKLLCNLQIDKKGIMQDGSFALQLPDRRVDLRVSIAPSTRGDKMVMRILDTHLAPKGLDALGMDPYILDQIRQRAFKESSMIVICGPTGSGKTTTVYAVIREMDAKRKNIVTVEDPVEYKLPNITQIQVNPKFDITFSSALSSLLRQDPDVILVGEIRDPQTAQMAVRSAMTGHVVLTTVHARDSIGCIFRLLDLGMEPVLLGSALTAVLSQRLLRKLCSHCKMKYKPALKELCRFGLEELSGQELYSAVGCDQCMNIGFKGRAAIFELLAITDQIRDAIAHRPTIQQLRQAAGDWIYQTLHDDGLRKVKQGLSTIEEFSLLAGKEK